VVDTGGPIVGKILGMTILESPPRQRLSVTRRVIGAVIGIVLLADIVVYGAARFLSDNVYLHGHYGNFMTGLGVLFACCFVGSIVVFPIRNSAVERTKPFVRMGLCALMVIAFVLAAIAHGFNIFTFTPRLIATSPNGKLDAAMVSNGQWEDLHIFTGSGFSQKDLGDVGAPCNFDKVTFASDTSMIVESGDETVTIPLDPTTGAPLRVLQRTCPFN
jgi:hypothetical protein